MVVSRYEDAFNRFIDEINSVAAYEWWEGSIHSILSVLAYPCAWSWKQWRRRKKILRLQDYVRSKYDHLKGWRSAEVLRIDGIFRRWRWSEESAYWELWSSETHPSIACLFRPAYFPWELILIWFLSSKVTTSWKLQSHFAHTSIASNRQQ